MANEYKALTVVNLPFIEERYLPGSLIPHSSFEEYIEAARAALGPEAEVPDADEVVAELTHYGSISEDLDAELHPDHRPVDPNRITLASLQAQAASLIQDLEAEGVEVPAKLRDLAAISDRQVSATDAGIAGDSHA